MKNLHQRIQKPEEGGVSEIKALYPSSELRHFSGSDVRLMIPFL